MAQILTEDEVSGEGHLKELEILELLRNNKGFARPEDWVGYGLAKRFTSVAAQHRPACPDCGSGEFRSIGQYVYYSNLIHLNDCRSCGLVYSDTLIDPDIVQRHFEYAYKDESYFLGLRRRIFGQIARLADERSPRGGHVLDIGGAKGHLLATLRSRRPDLRLRLNDLSEQACECARKDLALDTLCGGIEALEQTGFQFDTIIMSDVIYYEPELNRLWALLPRLLKAGGSLIIRVPNKFPLIRAHQLAWWATHSEHERRMQTSIKHFNPEHIYVFTPGYLLARLKQAGFTEASVTPSELLVRPDGELRECLYYYTSAALARLSFGKLITTPSYLICARKSA